ncbi:MAG: hypothetical protein JXK07_07475 [Spirochaetes bacterium]|nr:hypothetical protein [Spirochaetota bacterium]MBN2769694.1 hypothetical protein [Spirochaetota bacterium]
MKNITLSIDDELLAESRMYAQKHGTTLNSLVRNLLIKTVKLSSENTSEHILGLMKNSHGNSQGKKWSRDDLYDV